MKINILLFLTACVVFVFLAPSINAAEKTANRIELPKTIHYKINCPLPREARCVAKRIAPFGYTVLTENVDVEILNDVWVLNLKNIKIPASRKSELRVLSDDSVLHVIEVVFPEDKNQTSVNIIPTPGISNLPALKNSDGSAQNAPIQKGQEPPKSSPPESINSAKLVYADSQQFCESIKKNETIIKYLKIRERYISYKEKAGIVKTPRDNDSFFDTKDGVLKNWLDQNPVLKSEAVRISEMLTECAVVLRDSKYFPLFGIDSGEIEKIVKNSQQRNRVADASGNLLVTKGSEKSKSNMVLNPFYSNKYSNVTTFNGDTKLLVASLLVNGNGLLKNIEKEVFEELESGIKKFKTIADAKNKDEMEFASQIQEIANRLIKIKKGDVKSAQDCLDVALALDVDDESKLLPALTPSNDFRAAKAKLLNFDQGGLVKNGRGEVKSEDNIAIIKTTSKTLWFDKESISPGNSFVYFVGKYVDNEKHRLTNGAQRTLPLFDVLCIGLDIQAKLIQNFKLYQAAALLVNNKK